MRNRLLVGLCVAIGLLGAPATASPPNIVVFLVDDLGWQDTSVAFHTETTDFNRRYRTPNMQRLAARGMVFTNAYAHPVCSPSRVSLMTGLSPARHRVTNWTLRFNQPTDAKHPTLQAPQWNCNGLSPVPGIERTIHARALPDYLREEGYRTIHAGKAHFGAISTPGADPTNLGFDVNIAGHAAGAPGSYSGLRNFRSKPEGEPGVWDVPGLEHHHGKDISLTEAITTEAIDATTKSIDEGRPFFLYLAHYAVHTPIEPDPRFIGNYAGLDKTEAAYATMVEAMDHSLGRILDKLEAKGVANHTVILFMSDNGGLTRVARGGEPNTHNLPLSGGKGAAREGGTRVPMIAAWPGVTSPGSRCKEPVIIEDFFPTILEIAGVQPVSNIDGITFTDLLRGEPRAQYDDPRSVLLWHLPNVWIADADPGYGPHSSLRSGPWKIIYYHTPGRSPQFELFNLTDDIKETHNLAEPGSTILKGMASKLDRLLRERGAQFPIITETGTPVPGPVEALDAFNQTASDPDR